MPGLWSRVARIGCVGAWAGGKAAQAEAPVARRDAKLRSLPPPPLTAGQDVELSLTVPSAIAGLSGYVLAMGTSHVARHDQEEFWRGAIVAPWYEDPPESCLTIVMLDVGWFFSCLRGLTVGKARVHAVPSRPT